MQHATLEALLRQAGGSVSLPESPRHGAVELAAFRDFDEKEQRLLKAGGKELAPGVFLFEQSISIPELPGSSRLASLPGSKPALAADLLFFDTETTGLGGAGTQIFLLGLLYWSKARWVRRQLLLSRPAAESVWLQSVIALWPHGKTLVTYNGKSFDWPMLASRLAMHRFTLERAFSDHEDLLHRVRNLFSSVWPDCRLQTAEQELLGHFRDDDLPGSEAPEAWREFIRFGRSERLMRVVQHNACDLDNLARLYPKLAGAFHGEESRADRAGMARAWVRCGHMEVAVKLLRGAQEPLCERAELLLADCLRRQGEHRDAAEIWESRVARRGCRESQLRLAIHYEHRERDLNRALCYARNLVNLGATMTIADKRVARLRRKLACRADLDSS